MRDTYDVNTCRMFSKMSTLKNFGIILAVFFCQLQHDYAIPTLSICNSPENGRNCILECLETNLSSAVRFEHPLSTPQGTCLSASLCFSTNYNIYQNGNITFLNISELDRSRDEGQWYCFHGTQNDSQKLVVPSAIVSQIQPVVKVSKSDLKITCKMPCQYPVESLSVDVIYAIKDSSTYSIFPSRPTIINVTEFTNDVACDLKETNYQADLTYTKSSSTNFLEGKTLTVKCNITQSLIPSSSGDTGISSKEFDFTIKDVETTTTMKLPGKGLSKDAKIGIGIGVPCFLIIVVGGAVGVWYIYKHKKKDRTRQRKDKESQGTLTQNVDKFNNLENKPT